MPTRLFYNDKQHLKKLQQFWSTMDDIDKTLWVVDPKQPPLAASYRRVVLGEFSLLLY